MTTTPTRTTRATLGGPASASVVLHVALVASFLWAARTTTVALQTTYRVDLVAAPAGPRAIGEVAPPRAPTPPAPSEAAPPRRTQQAETAPAPTAKAAPARKPPLRATQVPNPPPKTATAPARAGGGPVGGPGADVANVSTSGISFPYQSYLDNIVRQLIVRFEPDEPRPLSVEVAFLIHRDGHISDFRFVKRSGSYDFDLEAQGAVEDAGRKRAFGPLPQGFRDDVLPVMFTFAPHTVRE